MHKKIPVAGPSITAHEISYVTDAVQNAWYGNHAIYHQRFEKLFAAKHGMAFAQALPSATSGLHLALLALGIKAGDEVIVPEITWIATAAPITYCGATPIFVDVEPDTWCLAVPAVARAITAKTKAIIPVHIYGNMVAMDELLALANQHAIPIIEDAAEAIGSRLNGKLAGSMGDINVFSFHGSKTMTTGEGGMVVTNNETYAKRMRFLADHGRVPGDFSYINSEVAHKYKMSAMQAALGLAQLERLDELVAMKRQIFSWYQQRLGDIQGLQLNPEQAGMMNSYWFSTVVFDAAYGMTKHQVIARLGELGIDARPFFSPLSALPAFADAPDTPRAQATNKVAYRVGEYGVNLPSALTLTEADVDKVCAALRQILRR